MADAQPRHWKERFVCGARRRVFYHDEENAQFVLDRGRDNVVAGVICESKITPVTRPSGQQMHCDLMQNRAMSV